MNELLTRSIRHEYLKLEGSPQLTAFNQSKIDELSAGIRLTYSSKAKKVRKKRAKRKASGRKAQ